MVPPPGITLVGSPSPHNSNSVCVTNHNSSNVCMTNRSCSSVYVTNHSCSSCLCDQWNTPEHWGITGG